MRILKGTQLTSTNPPCGLIIFTITLKSAYIARYSVASHTRLNFYTGFSGDHSEEETPDPIPNSEVKGLSGDGTAVIGRGRVARRRFYF